MYSQARNIKRPGGQSQRGFTLVEAMVAVMILSVGMIGLAYLQTTGMRFTTTSYQRTQASILAADYFDVMRAHGVISDAAYAAGGSDARDLIQKFDYDPNAVAPDCDHLAATVAEERNCWRRTLMQAIPSSGAEIILETVDPTATAAGGTMATIIIDWRELKPREDPRDPQEWVARSFTATSFLTEL